MNKDFPLGMSVKNRNNGRLGVIVLEPFGICVDNEVSVEWDGMLGSECINPRALEKLGILEIKASPKKCGNCVFLVQEYGWKCYRYTGKRYAHIIGPGSKFENVKGNEDDIRVPERIYPDCQIG